MKRNIFRLLLSAVLMMWCTVMANASNSKATKIENGQGRYLYFILDDATLTAAVTWGGDSELLGTNEYSGDIAIPFTITNSGKTYKVTSIGEDAFRNCNMLQSVTIPSGVTSIGSNAFYKCITLNNVTILPFNPPTIATTAFRENSSDIKLWVPDESKYVGMENIPSNISYMITNEYAPYILDEINAVWNRESLTAQDNELIESYITEIEGSESNAQIYADEQTIFEIIRLRPLKNEAIDTINTAMQGAPSSTYLSGLVQEYIDIINAVTDENTFTSKKNEIIAGLTFAIPAYQAGVTETLESLSHSEGTGNGVRITKDSQTIELMNPDKVEYIIRK